MRIPFLLSLRERGFRLTAVSVDNGTAFSRRGIPHRRIEFDPFATGGAQLSALRSVRRLVAKTRSDIIQSFDTKPNLLTPLSVRGQVPVVRTTNGLGWTFSSLEPGALGPRPVICSLPWLASLLTAATVFQNRDDRAFFERWWLTRKGTARLIAGSGSDVGVAAASHGGLSAAVMREQFGLLFAEIVIFVGGLTRQKGIPTLLAPTADSGIVATLKGY
ncbi:glycosyltransferase family 4 protein [Mesorhizobium sp. B1-1-8]|uniref:glycosyltransferase family 4 protein n=1 Tax=Mesorhizobium sp. B1-1-8 TaxID=2589976 RepID=UPI00112E80A1|nr:glycosyltransferase family 4 protein [Mesorhizobium sp. B1-1-8]UCI05476.1 hypothetical protein FJ974_16635 [Mesorhizobium sp. B1-1-8]